MDKVSTHRLTELAREALANRPLLWASRLATLGLGSHAEISVAESIHLGPWSVLLPVAIDTYAVSCFAARRAGLALAVLAITYGGGIGWLCWSESVSGSTTQLPSSAVGAAIGLILVVVLWHGERVTEDTRDERKSEFTALAKLESALRLAEGEIKTLTGANDRLRLTGEDISAAVESASEDGYRRGLADGESRSAEAAKLPHIGTGSTAPVDGLTAADMPFVETARKVAADPSVSGREAFKAAMREHGQPIGNDRYSRLIRAVAS